MKRNKRVMRRAILASLFDRLQEQYGIDWSREAFINGELTLPQVDALLAFKSDPRLDELRGALSRLDSGTYGFCIGCKSEISQDILDREPARRLCAACEQQLGHRLVPDYAAHAPVMG